MTFFAVVTRGLTRRPVRTGLTLIGISIGIAAVVALAVEAGAEPTADVTHDHGWRLGRSWTRSVTDTIRIRMGLLLSA